MYLLLQLANLHVPQNIRHVMSVSCDRGKGTFTLLYCDDSLRLLRGNGNSLVVQVRVDVLQKLLAKRRAALVGQ